MLLRFGDAMRFLIGKPAAVFVWIILVGSLGFSPEASSQRQRLQPPDASIDLLVGEAGVRGLASAIAEYEEIARRGGWKPIPGTQILRIDDDDERVEVLQARLRVTGDLKAVTRSASAFDSVVEEAVKSFQRRHGIEPNGLVYGLTLRTLNLPVADRIEQLKANFIRMRELLPRLNTRRYLLMNAANFELQGVDEGRVHLASRTVVGKRQTPTPTVSATVQAINLLPYWHVPGSIAQAALVPAVRKDPGYLQRERIRVFSSFGGEELDSRSINWWGPETTRLVFRQDPGPQNALGLVRLDMPNKHIVYMHDTPLKQLFGSFERAYSAGCVRVQSVFEVASWLLEGHGWSVDRLRQTVESGRAETIKLNRPVPIHFVYLTAWTSGGQVHFRNDLYNRDEAATSMGAEPTANIPFQVAP